jgi:hypothetical protein
MARPLRFEIPAGYWHTWNRGVNFGDIVVDDIDRRSFVALLAEAVRRYKWVILQFTLMTNHFLCAAAHNTSTSSSRRRTRRSPGG